MAAGAVVQRRDDGITAWQRAVSASVGALLTTLLTTPLDVAKTRIQAAAVAATTSLPAHVTAAAQPLPAWLALSPSAAACPYYAICRQVDPTFLRVACVHTLHHRQLIERRRHLLAWGSRTGAVTPPAPSLPAASPPPARGTLATLAGVARTEGVRRLWSGLGPGLAMAVPATALYFATYDELKGRLEAVLTAGSWPGLAAAAPLVAGIAGRTLTVTVVAPLELMRTRAMAVQADGGRRSLLARVRAELAGNGGNVMSLWRGWAPTLWRDVPFSGIYWLAYERIKAAATRAYLARRAGPAPSPELSLSETFSLAFVGGSAAGSLAALVTTPFDVVKTRRQLQLPHEISLSRGGGGASAAAAATASVSRVPVRTWDIVRFIAREEGLAGMFAGVGPRIAKVAPSCAIMIGSYELGKAVFGAQQRRGGGDDMEAQLMFAEPER